MEKLLLGTRNLTRGPCWTSVCMVMNISINDMKLWVLVLEINPSVTVGSDQKLYSSPTTLNQGGGMLGSRQYFGRKTEVLHARAY